MSKRDNMTSEEVVKDLEVLVAYFRGEYDAVPICLEKAIELLKKKSDVWKPF